MDPSSLELRLDYPHHVNPETVRFPAKLFVCNP